jgi:ATP-binding cassette, subfamily C, bacterial LapB
MLKLVDRLLVIDNGQVVRDGPKDAVLKGLAEGAAVLAQTQAKAPPQVLAQGQPPALVHRR